MNINQALQLNDRIIKKTFTLRSIGSLLIRSIKGGLLRGVPVVSKSVSVEAPKTLTPSQRLMTNRGEENKNSKKHHSSVKSESE